MKDTGLNGYVYDFSVDYDAADVNKYKWKIILYSMYV